MSECPGNTALSIYEPTLQEKRAARSECQCMKGRSVKREAGGKLPCHSACLEKLQGNIMIISTLLKLCSLDLPPQWDKSTYFAGRIGQPSLPDMFMNTKHKICENVFFIKAVFLVDLRLSVVMFKMLVRLYPNILHFSKIKYKSVTFGICEWMN